MADLVFDPERHEYHLDGRRLPNVTEILQSVGLIDFSGIDADVLEYARQRGQFIHQATALYDQNDLDEETLSPVLKPYVEAWKRFRAESGFVPGYIEKPSYHPVYRYAGTADRAGILHGKPAIIDIKPPSAKPWWKLQTAAYSLIWFPASVAIRLAVSLCKDGTYRVDRHEDHTDSKIFLSALAVHNWKVSRG